MSTQAKEIEREREREKKNTSGKQRSNSGQPLNPSLPATHPATQVCSCVTHCPWRAPGQGDAPNGTRISLLHSARSRRFPDLLGRPTVGGRRKTPARHHIVCRRTLKSVTVYRTMSNPLCFLPLWPFTHRPKQTAPPPTDAPARSAASPAGSAHHVRVPAKANARAHRPQFVGRDPH